MRISVAWLNRLLEPGDCTPDEADRALTNAGFPIESRDKAGSDTVLDVEVTSNRGDALCHLGCAREVAAVTGRRLKSPFSEPWARIDPSNHRGPIVENRVPDDCPVFTARLIRGVRVGPSPDWMRAALEAVGQKSVNNVVDASNYALFEIGQPSHAFDFGALRGDDGTPGRIIVRRAHAGERLAALDGRTHALQPDDVVVADAAHAVGLAGVIGGVETSVTAATTDVLLEVATWAPTAVRRASRRLGIRTDASHRYERIVPAATVFAAADLIAGLIVRVAGGRIEGGRTDAPADAEDRHARRTVVNMRHARCDALLGAPVDPARASAIMLSLGIDTETAGGALRCTIPPHRPDLTREVDLIEEVGRINGLDGVPVRQRMSVEVRPPQASERAMAAIGGALTAMGFFETVTFSFTTRAEATEFMPPGMAALAVDEARRAGAPALRPSMIPSLLHCAALNRRGGARPEGGLRLFETGAVFAEAAPGRAIENRNLALLVERPGADAQETLRLAIGAIERVAGAVGGGAAGVRITPMEALTSAMRADACGGVTIGGERAGYVCLLSDAALRARDLDGPAGAAEISLDLLTRLYPPRSVAVALPEFPGTERDLSVVVSDDTAWSRVAEVIADSLPARCTGFEFVGAYRGKQIGPGKKSVTVRLMFRDPSRTLRHEEVEPEVARVVRELGAKLGAELRA